MKLDSLAFGESSNVSNFNIFRFSILLHFHNILYYFNDVEGFDGAGRNAACRCDDCTRKLDAGHRAFSIRVFEGAG